MESASLNASFLQLGVLLLVSLLLGSIVSFLGLPSVIGYLIAGLSLGPQGLGLVKDQTLINYISELGVLLLLFYMGLEISLKKFSRAGTYALFLSPIKSGVGFALGFLAAKALGLPTVVGVVFGASLAVSSTAIITQIILEKHWQDALEAQISVAMLILEDIFSVFIIGYLLGATGGISVGKIIVNSIVVLFVMFVIGNRLSRRLLRLITKYGKPEHFSLYAFSLLLIFAYGVYYVGMSPLLGAFFAGMLLSETVHAKRIEEELMGFRKLFVVIFFTALGLKYTVSFGSLAVKLTLIGLLILLIQRLVLFLSGPVFGLSPRKSARLAVLMLPVGEFSLFTAASLQALDLANARPEVLAYFGLTPEQAAVVASTAPEIMGATFILIFVTTILSGIVFKREEAIEERLVSMVPDAVLRLSEALHPYFRASGIISEKPGAMALVVEKKTQRMLEYFFALVAIAYLTGYLASEYPFAAFWITLAGYLFATYPLTSIVLAIYAIMIRYAEEITRFSGLPPEFNRRIARSMAYVFVGIFMFVFGIIALALAQGLDVVTFWMLAVLLITASVAMAGYGIFSMLRAFMEPIPVSRTTRRGSSARRKRALRR